MHSAVLVVPVSCSTSEVSFATPVTKASETQREAATLAGVGAARLGYAQSRRVELALLWRGRPAFSSGHGGKGFDEFRTIKRFVWHDFRQAARTPEAAEDLAAPTPSRARRADPVRACRARPVGQEEVHGRHGSSFLSLTSV